MSSKITLNPSAIARGLGAFSSLLLLASIGFKSAAYLTGRPTIYGLVKLFNLDAEQNIPAFFSTLMLLFAALLLALISRLERSRTASRASHWTVLSFGFFFMAADEACSIHELLGELTRRIVGGENLGVFYFSWVIPGIALIAALAPFFLRFASRLPSKTKNAFLLAAAIYLGGAMGFELIGGRYAELHGQERLPYIMFATIEESLEMAGIIIFIRALLSFIADHAEEVRFSILRGGKN